VIKLFSRRDKRRQPEVKVVHGAPDPAFIEAIRAELRKRPITDFM